MVRKAGNLRVLDQLEAPDLWPEIRGREPRRLPEEPRTVRRALVAALALAIAAAAIAFAVRAFEVAERTSRPASTVENGLLAFSGGGQIRVVSPDGSGLRQLTHLGGHDALDVHWSPDGSKLGFRVWTKGDYELFVTNADGSGLTNVTGSMGVSEFAWSPDGSRLAFTAFQKGNDFDVFVVNADGTGLRAVVESPLSEHRPQWSPDGTQIAFERWPVHDRDPGTPDIYTFGLEGDEPVPLVTSSGWDTGAAWSPDGTQIAFSSERDGDEEIYLVNADGSSERKLTDLPGVDATNAAWSPDGTQISFVAHDGEQWDDWVVNADGSGLLKLTPSDRDDGPAVWAPDGSLLAFTASKVIGGVDNTETYDVYTIRPDGTDERRITFGRLAMGWDLSWQRVIATGASPKPTERIELIDTRVTEEIPVGAFPRAVAVGEGAVWVSLDNANGGPRDHLVVRIDPSTNEVVASIPVFEAGDIAAGDGAVWVTSRLDNAEGALVRIDPSTNQVVASVPVGMNPSNVALGDGAVWVTVNETSAGFRPSGEVIRIDPLTNEVVARITIGGGWPRDVVVGEGSVWIYGHSDYTSAGGWEGSSLWRIDPARNELVGVILDDDGFLGDGGALPDNVAAGEGAVWVADDRGRGLRIDPSAGGITRFDVHGGFAWPFLVEGGRVWFGRDEIRVLDGTTFQVVGGVQGEIEAVDAAFDQSTSTLWVANYEGTIARVDLS